MLTIALFGYWFGASPLPYYLVALLALFVFLALAVLPESPRTTSRPFEYAFLATAGLTLLAWRWPAFLWPNPLNPDEALWVAGGLKMMADWVPWRGFDGSTSGPITPYTLALPALFGGRIDFFSARLLGVCLLTGTAAALYYVVKWMAGTRVARLALAPSVLFLALTKDWNFLHFSSEIVPVFLTTLALAACAFLSREASQPRNRIVACAIAGLSIGSSGLAKLQALPLAFALLILAGAGIICAHRRSWKGAKAEALVFLSSICLVPAMVAITLWATGELQYAIQSYLKSSAGYVGEGIELGPSFLFHSSSSYTAFLVPSMIVAVVGLVALVYWRKMPSPRLRIAVAASLLLLLAAGFAIYAPRRSFQHYLLFSVVPLSCCLATVLALLREANSGKRQREGLIAGSYIGLFLLAAIGVAMSSAPSSLVAEAVSPTKLQGSRAGKAVARYAPPGSHVAIWGSCPELYVQTQTIMATRYGQMGPIGPGPNRDYYERQMMRDLEKSKPRVFVDAVHPGAFRLHDRATQGYENFPALAAYVRRHYQFKEEVAGVRIFVAKGEGAGSAPPNQLSSEAGWRIQFSKGGGSEPYRVSGWSGSEPDFTWTEGSSAKLALPIAEPGLALSLHMKLGGLLHPPELTAQNVVVFANGKKIADWKVTDDAEFSAPVPVELTKSASLELELRVPDAASPQSLGMSYDDRLLGVRCYWLELDRR